MNGEIQLTYIVGESLPTNVLIIFLLRTCEIFLSLVRIQRGHVKAFQSILIHRTHLFLTQECLDPKENISQSILYSTILI